MLKKIPLRVTKKKYSELLDKHQQHALLARIFILLAFVGGIALGWLVFAGESSRQVPFSLPPTSDTVSQPEKWLPDSVDTKAAVYRSAGKIDSINGNILTFRYDFEGLSVVTISVTDNTIIEGYKPEANIPKARVTDPNAEPPLQGPPAAPLNLKPLSLSDLKVGDFVYFTTSVEASEAEVAEALTILYQPNIAGPTGEVLLEAE